MEERVWFKREVREFMNRLWWNLIFALEGLCWIEDQAAWFKNVFTDNALLFYNHRHTKESTSQHYCHAYTASGIGYLYRQVWNKLSYRTLNHFPAWKHLWAMVSDQCKSCTSTARWFMMESISFSGDSYIMLWIWKNVGCGSFS